MFDEKIKYFEEKQKEIVALIQELEKKKSEYKAEFKAAFGITDGEPANVLEIIKTIKTVMSMQ